MEVNGQSNCPTSLSLEKMPPKLVGSGVPTVGLEATKNFLPLAGKRIPIFRPL